MYIKTKLLLFALFATIVIGAYAQSDPNTYLDNAWKLLEAKDCEGAQRNYDIYKKLTGNTVSYLQSGINNCKNNKGGKYLEEERNNYLACPFVTYGGGFPWCVFTSIEYRHGEQSGFGLYGDLGVNFTNVSYTYDSGAGHLTKGSFKYAFGIKYFPAKGFFLGLGYGSISKATADVYYPEPMNSGMEDDIRKMVERSHGLLFNLGYDYVENLRKGSGWFIGVSAGMTYDVINKVLAPSILLKVGGAFSLN